MLKHVFTFIWNNRKPNLWLVAGLFVISTCLWFAVDYAYAIGINRKKSLGFDWHNVYNLSIGTLTPESPRYSSDERHTTNGGEDFITFLNRLEQHPKVESVCFTQNHRHYVWTNAGANLIVDTLKASSWFRRVSPDYFKVFKVHGADGKSPADMAEAAVFTDFIVTENLAKRLFPAGDAVGQRVKETTQTQDSARISAVCENQKYNEYTDHMRAVYSIFNMDEVSRTHFRQAGWYGVYIRVRPEADGKDFVRTFRKEMSNQLKIGNLYLENIRPMSVIRDEHLKSYRSDLYTYLSIAVFFLLNVFLAVLGTFWYRTQYRRPELGLRQALGSTKRSISAILFAEGLILLTIAFVPAILVAYNLGRMDVVATYPVLFTAGRFAAGLAITYVLLAATVLFGIWFPARQAMRVNPADVLHEE